MLPTKTILCPETGSNVTPRDGETDEQALDRHKLEWAANKQAADELMALMPAEIRAIMEPPFTPSKRCVESAFGTSCRAK